MLHEANTAVPQGYTYIDIIKKRMYGIKLKTSCYSMEQLNSYLSQALNDSCYKLHPNYNCSLQIFTKNSLIKYYNNNGKTLSLEHYKPCVNRVVDYYKHNNEDMVYGKIMVLHNALLKHKVAKKDMDYILQGAGKLKKAQKNLKKIIYLIL
ncbi:hypothetical protein IMX26_10005 [Clostridium sp. 'deep sea']|uniref:hypothetical protein n=1 Tax=Clostridium sp. 'deep sea' TaxID=2779445 RepID=UPI0018964998|nr:hypothetical protein [Clostridium sp. 'deep sea']QOR33835.1 hypothetical protein IMX26_10005 [Clostridium sp. 'deep sea']